MTKIKVLIVDDSPLFRRFISDGLSKYDYLDIVGYAVDPVDAEAKIKLLKPDVISCDVEMPRMDGITFVKKLMRTSPARVIVVSAINISVFEAISAGAVDFVRKPSGKDPGANQQFLDDLADKIVIASQARLRIKSEPLVKPGAPSASLQDAPKPAASLQHADAAQPAPLHTFPPASAAPAASKVSLSGRGSSTVIAIGASTGGTEAVLEVVKEFPADTPGVVIVQHMPAGFTRMYADRLNKICNMEVREARNGDQVHRGLILIAPGDFQMTLVKNGGEYSVRCVPGNKVSGHRPSVDVLFSSVAQSACPNAIGAILTGMGGDGARGLLEMKNAGAYTIGQDEASCVVYGMPMVAYNMGAVTKQAPLDRIAGLILGQAAKM